VHGTSNLRVADGSIIPLPVAAHIQATVYAIGEKVGQVKSFVCRVLKYSQAADLIKADM
jgi:hypothetical protein